MFPKKQYEKIQTLYSSLLNIFRILPVVGVAPKRVLSERLGIKNNSQFELTLKTLLKWLSSCVIPNLSKFIVNNNFFSLINLLS